MSGNVTTGQNTTNSIQSGVQNSNYLQNRTPWDVATPNLTGILSNLAQLNPNITPMQTGALNALNVLGGQGNPFTAALSGATNTLLGGGNPALASIAGSNPNPMATPGISNAINAMNADITNQINGQFAAAGRDTSPANSQALARGLAQGEGSLLANQYNTNIGNILAAANAQTNNIMGGGNLSNTAVNAMTYGPLLQLQAEAQRTGIPLQNLAAQAGIALPIGSAFGTTSGTQSGTSYGTGQSTTQQQSPLWQQIAGGVIGGAGLLGDLGWHPFGPSTAIQSPSNGAIY